MSIFTQHEWESQIRSNNKLFPLGYYKDFLEAVCARLAGEQALGWKGCEADSPAYRYVCNTLGV